MTAGRIETLDDVEEGATWLAGRDARLAAALSEVGPLTLRMRDDGYTQLLSMIVSQQVSVASAASIWDRLKNAGYTTEKAVLSCTDETLRGLGLSRQKALYARALAEAQIDYAALRTAPDAEIVATLTQVKGIGVWTSEIYGMFSLGRPDMFAAGDLALQEAARLIFDLPDRPKEKALREMAEDWRPWRAVAARLFFTYYRKSKGREGVT